MFMAFVGSTWYEKGLDKDSFMNYSWNSSQYQPEPNTKGFNGNFLGNIITKTVDWFGYSFYEISKAFFAYGYDHPEYNFKWYAWAFLIVGCLSFLMPIIYLIALIGFGVYYLSMWFRKKVFVKGLDK